MTSLPVTNDIALLLPFDGANGSSSSTSDISPSNNTVVLTNATISTEQGKWNSSLKLDGNSYASIESNSSINFDGSSSFTIEFWVFSKILCYHILNAIFSYERKHYEIKSTN